MKTSRAGHPDDGGGGEGQRSLVKPRRKWGLLGSADEYDRVRPGFHYSDPWVTARQMRAAGVLRW